MHSVATEYGWPDDRPIVKTAVNVDPKVLADYVGTYEMEPTFSLVFSVEDGHLAIQPTGQSKLRLFAESSTKFFPLEVDAVVEFVKDSQGKVTQLILHQGGHDNRAVRK